MAKPWPESVSRRDVLQIAGGLGIASLAGCSGGGDGAGATADGDGKSLKEPQLDFQWARKPTDIHLNRYNRTGYGQSYQDVFRHVLARGYADGSVGNVLLESQEIDGKEITYTFPEGPTWWNGDALTAEDFYVGAELQRVIDGADSAFEGHELVDDYTVTRTFKKEAAPKLMKSQAAGVFVDTPRSVYNSWFEKYQDASSESEKESVITDLQKMKISLEDFIDKGLGSGLYKLEEFNSSESILTKYGDHELADKTNIDKVRMIPRGTGSGLVENDKMDFIPKGFLPNSGNIPSNLENQNEFAYFRTQKMSFNYQNKHLAKLPVRRAIIHAIDQNPLVQTATQGKLKGTTTEVQTGLRSSIHDKFLGEGWTDKLIQYPVEADVEGANKLMNDAGYSKEDGTWVGPDGEVVEFDLLVQSTETFQIGVMKRFSDQLESFGVKTNLQSVESNFYSKLEEYNHDITWIWHVARALWHPVSYFSNNFYGILVGNPEEGGDTGPTGIPYEVELPTELGKRTTDGDTKTVKPVQLMRDLPVAGSEKEVKEITRELVWWFNYRVPDFVYLQEFSGYWGDSGNFTFPDPNEVKLDLNRPGQFVLKQGMIDGKTE